MLKKLLIKINKTSKPANIYRVKKTKSISKTKSNNL